MLCESFIVDMEKCYSATRPHGPIKPQGKRVSGLQETSLSLFRNLLVMFPVLEILGDPFCRMDHAVTLVDPG